MGSFKWDESLDTKVVPMDAEHRRIVEVMNRLEDEWKAKAPRTRLAATLDELVQLTRKHFESEEAYMTSIGYPDLSTHRAIHKSLLGQVGSHVEAFTSGGELTQKFFQFLTIWLRAHMGGIDAKYGAAARRKAG